MGWNFVVAFGIAATLIWVYIKIVESIVNWFMRGLHNRQARKYANKHFETTERYRRGL